MRKAASSIAAIGLMFAAASAAAQTGDLPVVYGGVSIGASKAKGFCTGLPASASCDDAAGALKLFGGYQFHRNFAVELGIGGMGEWSARGPGGVVEVSSGVIEATGLGIVPLGDQFSLFGKAGIYRANTQVRFNTFTLVGDVDESNTGFTAGFGMRFDFTRSFGLRLEWQRYFEVGGDLLGEPDVDTLSIGVQIKF